MTTARETLERAAAPPAFRPLIPASATLDELTAAPLIVGMLLGVIFGASSLYLVLKVGLTVSASIPVAVISITLFRLLGRLGLRSATVLEHNIVQTAGSAGESIAFGIGVTMPAIMILGFDLQIARVMLVALLGALLGILMMIPLRRALIVQQHGVLKYPEGTACAAVLEAGATREERALGAAAALDAPEDLQAARFGAGHIFAGFAAGVLYKLAMEAFRLWKDTPAVVFGQPLAAGSLAAEISPELLGVGYIIGPKIASTMAAGGVLAYMVLIPAIRFFGAAAPGAVAPGTGPIAAMGPDDIRGAYVLYIGAGAVAVGGIISLARSLPMIGRGIAGGLADWRSRRGEAARAAPARTDRDLSGRFVGIGLAVLIIAILSFHTLRMNLAGALAIVIFGFLFVTVSSRLTGEIGSSSNPISGMTVATLLLTCLAFLAAGWTGPTYYVTALSVGGIVCVAASNGGTTSQDLKTGFLIGSTPRSQQIAILAGACLSALVLGPILLTLNDSSTVYVPVREAWRAPAAALAALPTERVRGPQAKADPRLYKVFQKTDEAGGAPGRYLVDAAGAPVWLVDPGINGTHRVRPDGTTVTKFAAPKATLMSYIIKGILNRQLPWTLVILGGMIAVVLKMCGIASLAFAVGVYLPISSSAPVFIGGMVRALADRHLARRHAGAGLSPAELIAQSDKSPGVLVASGYIAGGAIAGIGIAFMAGVLTGFDQQVTDMMTARNPFFSGPYSDLLALVPFAVLIAGLFLAGLVEAVSEGRRALARKIEAARRIVVFTGAGISTESGIPDFRSPGGVWSRMKPIYFQDFVASEEKRREAWGRAFSGAAGWVGAEPNAGHHAVARLVAQGRCRVVITQNVDNLHQASGVPPEQVIEVHGNASYAACLACGLRHELVDLRGPFVDLGVIPACRACGGIVKTATISFGQPMPVAAMERAEAESRACDLFLVLGSSLVVYPAAALPLAARDHGAHLAIVNREATDLDPFADLALHDEIGPAMTAAVAD